MNCKRFLSCTLAAVIASQNCQAIFAGEKGGVDRTLALSSSAKTENNKIYISTKDFSPQQKEFLSKLKAMFGEFYLKDNKLDLKISLDDLQKKYSLNEYDMAVVRKMLHMQNSDTDEKPNLKMYVEDWKLCFEPGELNIWLLSAASLGPEALIAAFEAIGAMTGGIVGVVIATIIAYLGGINPVQICGEIITACANNWGWYIGVDPLHFQIVYDYIY